MPAMKATGFPLPRPHVRPTLSRHRLRIASRAGMDRRDIFLRRSFIVVALVATSIASCARRQPYRLGSESQYYTADELRAVTKTQIERGSPRPLIDGLGWFVGIPGKITLWDRRIDNHKISATTESAVAQYLAANELSTVKVRLNQYAPRDEWRRLTHNKSVSWGWRYTFGTVSWLGYTLFPGRIWGGDNFNPYTNTISLFSDIPAIGLHEAGHAKDFARREFAGTYAAIYTLPIVPLWHEAVATRDALDYLHDFGTLEERQEAYMLLYPAYGTYVGGAIGDWVPGYGFAAYAAAVVGGHAVGRVQAARLEPRQEISQSTPSELDWPGTPPEMPTMSGAKADSSPLQLEPKNVQPFGEPPPHTYPDELPSTFRKRELSEELH